MKKMNGELLTIVKAKETSTDVNYVQLPIWDEIYLAFVIDLAKKYGIKQESSSLSFNDILPFKLTIDVKRGTIHYNMINSTATTEVTLDEVECIFDYLKNKRECEIFIGEYQVKFLQDGGIQVGCKNIPFAKIEKIYQEALKRKAFVDKA